MLVCTLFDVVLVGKTKPWLNSEIKNIHVMINLITKFNSQTGNTTIELRIEGDSTEKHK